MFMEEIWKDIPGYEGYYQVSNLGRVKSLDRKVWKFGKQWVNMKGVLITPVKNRSYLTLRLSGKRFYIHQLVAMAFLNHKPNGFNDTVDHIDFNHSNNRVENLRIISHKENSRRHKIKYHLQQS